MSHRNCIRQRSAHRECVVSLNVLHAPLCSAKIKGCSRPPELTDAADRITHPCWSTDARHAIKLRVQDPGWKRRAVAVHVAPTLVASYSPVPSLPTAVHTLEPLHETLVSDAEVTPLGSAPVDSVHVPSAKVSMSPWLCDVVSLPTATHSDAVQLTPANDAAVAPVGKGRRPWTHDPPERLATKASKLLPVELRRLALPTATQEVELMQLTATNVPWIGPGVCKWQRRGVPRWRGRSLVGGDENASERSENRERSAQRQRHQRDTSAPHEGPPPHVRAWRNLLQLLRG